MKPNYLLSLTGALCSFCTIASAPAHAASILVNGNLDLCQPVEIVPGFFLPKPLGWVNEGSRAITGPYEDEMSSEPWAGPAPTPVTTNGVANPPHPGGCGGPDCGVFFKAFSGNQANGAATGHLYQDNPATPGLVHTFTGWVGAEANYLATRSELAIEFFNGANALIASNVLDLVAAGLFQTNGQPFNYKQYTVAATAPQGATTVRVRVSMIEGSANPMGGGQAFVVDDFELIAESAAPATLFNGDLDLCQAVEIVPGFFLPKPRGWVNEGTRAITGPYEDEMSSEPWAGPSPTPVTTNGLANPPHPEGCGGLDCGVFFKAFSGNMANGAATGHLYQDVPASPGMTYILTGWAGAEANYLANRSELAIEFYNAGATLIASNVLNLVAAGLFQQNGHPFNYKQYTLVAKAPSAAATIRVRASMIGGTPNPLGGGQAFVVDDFDLIVQPLITSLDSVSPGGGRRIIARTEANRAYVVEAAETLNALPESWIEIGSAISNSSGVFEFEDIEAPLFEQRFYRLRRQ